MSSASDGSMQNAPAWVPSISGNGEFITFASPDNFGGPVAIDDYGMFIFRKHRSSGAVDSIALSAAEFGAVPTAGLPVSMSRNGSVLLFSTKWPLLADDTNDERVFVTLYGLTLLSIRLLGYALDAYARREHLYSTDAEHKQDDLGEVQSFVEFFRDADLVIFDSQYSLAEATSIKEDWGHSSNIVGLELCQRAHAKRLCLYHHEPLSDDQKLAALLAETRRLEEITRGDRRVEILAAYDGMEIAL